MTGSGLALEVEQKGPVRWLWLNRPERRNALNDTLVGALDAAIDAAEGDRTTKAIVVAGRGRSFCGGADLTALLACAEDGRSPVDLLTRISATFTRLERCPIPVVAALHGHAVAGGLELALAADVVVAADTTLIGDGHVRNELMPGGGSSLRLPRAVGENNARWLLLSGELVPASSRSLAGWLHAVVPGAGLQEATEQTAEKLVARSGEAQRRLKPLLAEADRGRADEALAAELEAFERHWEDAPIAERLRAFLAGEGRAVEAPLPVRTT